MVYGLILWTACEHSSVGWKKKPSLYADMQRDTIAVRYINHSSSTNQIKFTERKSCNLKTSII